jgi:hypothetical protein
MLSMFFQVHGNRYRARFKVSQLGVRSENGDFDRMTARIAPSELVLAMIITIKLIK